MTSKAELRQRVLFLKKRLSKRQITQQSKRVVSHIARWSVYRTAKKLLFYAATSSEVQLQALLKKALLEGKSPYLPVCRPGSNLLRITRVTPKTKLIRGPYGILQPRAKGRGQARLDVVMVPGLAFDSQGNRLGRGKGYYDRFLCRRGIRTVKVGLALSQQVFPRVPAGRKDVRMDYLATPQGIKRCRGRLGK